MKKDKEWLKKALDKSITGFNGRELSRYETGRLDGYTHATMLIDQLDEPEKVVIPQFVADYYNDWKDGALSFEEWFDNCTTDKHEVDTFSWLNRKGHKTSMERHAILADIIAHGLDGYKIEKEPLFAVLINPEFFGSGLYLFRHEDGSVGVGNNLSVYDMEQSEHKLTKTEIESVDPRFMVFAVEVDNEN